MKVLDKAGLFAALVVPLCGCAARTAPPAASPPLLPQQAVAHAFVPAPVHGAQGWALPQEWPASLPQGWAAPQGWALPHAWQPPATWPFPWLAPQARKPPAVSKGAPAAVAYARSRLGTPYCWGGTGPTCYDCSGLTNKSWSAGGKTIPRTSEAQADQLPEVPLGEILPGDILWRPGHVALYVGDGKVIHAPRTGDVIKYSPAANFRRAVRP